MRKQQRLVAVVALLVIIASLPPEAAADATSDAYIQGYASAILEEKFGVEGRTLGVRDGVVTIAASELAGSNRGRVLAALRRIAGVSRVDVVDVVESQIAAPGPAQPAPPTEPLRRPGAPRLEPGPMPGGELFRPLMADPRWPHFSAGYQRYLDDPDFKDVAAVSFGETFAVYRWRVAPGWFEAGIQAGVFAIFDLDSPSFDLVNADYFVAAAVAYRREDFAALARLFHQSSHLGDEFLLRRTRVDRVNLSYEGVDAKLSYDFFGDVLRLYAGGGYIFDIDPSNVAPWSVQYGVELRSPWPGPDRAWQPIAAVDVQHREQNDWSADLSVRVGVQFGGVLASRDMQLLLEYFNGRSPNGQFFTRKVDYLGLGVHFHF